MSAAATGRAPKVADVKRMIGVAEAKGLRVKSYTVNVYTGEITVLTEAANEPSVRDGETAWDQAYPTAA